MLATSSDPASHDLCFSPHPSASPPVSPLAYRHHPDILNCQRLFTFSPPFTAFFFLSILAILVLGSRTHRRRPSSASTRGKHRPAAAGASHTGSQGLSRGSFRRMETAGEEDEEEEAEEEAVLEEFILAELKRILCGEDGAV